MTAINRARGAAAAILAATLGLPFLGAWWAGRDLRPILRFPPPLVIPTHYPRWSWTAFGLVLAPFIALAVAWIIGHRRADLRSPTSPATPQGTHGLPWWGAPSMAWTVAWWILAWSRFDWFAPLQVYTFFPLWLGFICSVNALTQARHGTCLMIRCPRRWLALFAASAAFWWVFEWLNRFTHNWHYLGAERFGAIGYAVHATVCFSTVLPAVAAVAELLSAIPRWQAAVAHGARLRWLNRRGTGTILGLAGVAALVGTGARPEQFYPALWAAPLTLLVADSILNRRDEMAAAVARGDWREAAPWAVAALICGFWWEMWNLHSAAKWIYTVPYVDRGHVFEMPILGYLGYLPFGLECYFVVARSVDMVSFSSASSK